MNEYVHLIIQCFICLFHGFGTKTGGEEFLKVQGIKKNKKYYLGSQRNLRDGS